MSKVIIVGGGYAGIAAATALVEAGVTVDLLESRGSLGGRAYSIPSSENFPAPMDNGPHLFMGCYAETLRALDRIGARDSFHWIDPLALSWLTSGGKKVSLQCASLPAPFHLAWGLLSSDAFPWREKIPMTKALSAFSKKPFRIPRGAETVAQFLDATGQGPLSRERFWVPLCDSVMNVPPAVAPIAGLGEVLNRIFFGARRDSALGMARFPLGELVSEKARNYLEAKGGRVHFHEGVQEFTVKGKTFGVKTRSGSVFTGDAIVFAVPPPSLAALWPKDSWEPASHFSQMGKSPIISVQVILSKPVIEGHLTGLSGAKFEWVFNRNANWNWTGQGAHILQMSSQPKLASSLEAQGRVQYLSFTASAADDLAHLKDPELVELAMRELRERCPAAAEATVLHSKATREMAATFRWTRETDTLRPPCQTPFPGVFLAGDWTDTGLPATIEGACLSGHRAAEKVRAYLS
jgi:hydroxysqualene dehydroxylase